MSNFFIRIKFAKILINYIPIQIRL